ncbi:5-(carboxyamino)imidazole ribonucleotide synthase [Chrysiogenes arsenatis]|uniref:5-(carboxyamino)imidazole ribonucleotide synthase n=1 Tax=Chrysiogenes arsenatis TaxID=309797 RepID=UPI00041DCE06|nr:5-(carboxyamino)imidazole ribonucleotide synthase [Chrysiogenes arsenatis]
MPNLDHCQQPTLSKRSIGQPTRLGIIGGGQLAKMLTMEAKKLGFSVQVLDPTSDSPAGQVSDRQIVGGFFEHDKLRELATESDILTYDLEHIDTTSLRTLEAEGAIIHPAPDLLETLQDKWRQKELFAKAGLPQPAYERMDTLDTDAMRRFGFPLVQKIRRGGYDGRGVVILRDASELHRALNGPSLLERCVPLAKELAVMVARTKSGEVRTYPVAEMIFDSRSNALDILLAPARIDDQLASRARSLAKQTAEACGAVGIFGVEMFLTQDGDILVNEVAPRPHNSGHYTIEACRTSQYEQHLRAISGLPLGLTDQHTPAAMINLVGEPDAHGQPLVEGLAEALALPGVSVHLYGKREVRPFRKMGHAVAVDPDPEKALAVARTIKHIIKIQGDKTHE